MSTDSPTLDDCIHTPAEINQGMIVRRPGKWDIRVTNVIHQTVYFEYIQGDRYAKNVRTAPGTAMTRKEFFDYFKTDDVLWLRKQGE